MRSSRNLFAYPFEFPIETSNAFSQIDDVAIRAFSAECNRAAPDNPVFANRGDYDLIKIGEYYESSGTIISCDPVVLVHGRDVARAE